MAFTFVPSGLWLVLVWYLHWNKDGSCEVGRKFIRSRGGWGCLRHALAILYRWLLCERWIDSPWCFFMVDDGLFLSWISPFHHLLLSFGHLSPKELLCFLYLLYIYIFVKSCCCTSANSSGHSYYTVPYKRCMLPCWWRKTRTVQDSQNPF